MVRVTELRDVKGKPRAARAFSAALALLLVSVFLAACQTPSAPPEHPIVRLQTQLGNIDIELYPHAAPNTVANFLAYVEGGFYASQPTSTGSKPSAPSASFYRTVRGDNQRQNKVKIAVIQGGLLGQSFDQSVTALPPVIHETTQQTGVMHRDGVISLARLEPGSGSSDFFICIGDQPALDYGGQRNPDGLGFAAFGKVIRGMAVVKKIHQASTVPAAEAALDYTSGQILQQPVLILASERLNKPINRSLVNE